jgi:hypothetical protein
LAVPLGLASPAAASLARRLVVDGEPAASERSNRLSAVIITRIQTGDYGKWRPLFDQDVPHAREKAGVVRVLRSVDDPNEVFVHLEYASLEDAEEARQRLLDSGVLDRFEDTHGPNVLIEAG